jgi:hypothetical protein
MIKITSNEAIQCYRHCKERGGERFEPITPPHSPRRRCTCRMYISRHVCYQDRENESSSATRQATSVGPGGAFDSPSGCPQWEVP